MCDIYIVTYILNNIVCYTQPKWVINFIKIIMLLVIIDLLLHKNRPFHVKWWNFGSCQEYIRESI